MDKQWCDSYRVSLGIGEMEIRFQVAGEDVDTIVISLPLAKSLAASLARAVAVYEQQVGQEVLLPEEIQQRLSGEVREGE